MTRRKTNVKQVCQAIRRDLIDRLGLEMPIDEIEIRWKGGDRETWINVKTRQVWTSYGGRVQLMGTI